MATARRAARPAAGGGRWVQVHPDRLVKWLDGFAERHGDPVRTAEAYGLRLSAPDGTVAELHTPPGVPAASPAGGSSAGASSAGASSAGASSAGASSAGDDSIAADFVAAVRVERTIGLLLARQAAVAVGIAAGDRLVESKIDTSYVQGRTAAGGWSQQRFARRRGNQARAAAGSAADIAVRLLLPALDRLAAVVTGGDRRAVEAVLADARLAPLRARRAEVFLDVGEPRLAVLTAAAGTARTVQIKIFDPE